jgi:hypothetical protein
MRRRSATGITCRFIEPTRGCPEGRRRTWLPKDSHGSRQLDEHDGVREVLYEDALASQLARDTNDWAPVRTTASSAVQGRVDRDDEPSPRPARCSFVPRRCVADLLPRLGRELQRFGHRRRDRSSSRISVRACSQGIPPSGLAIASRARRSISADHTAPRLIVVDRCARRQAGQELRCHVGAIG